MNKLYEEIKVDVGIAPVSLASGNLTSAYYSLADYHKALAVLLVAAMAITKVAKIEVFQGKDSAGGSGKLLTGATATITANINVASLTMTLASVLNTHTIVINGLTFTAHTDTTDVTLRQFSIATSDTAGAVELAICVNDATYGVPGVAATSAAAVVTLVSSPPGATVITAAQGVGATITVATLKALAYVELDALTLEAGFTHIATKVTTDSTQVVGSVIIRGGQRLGITQKVGASASV